MISWRNDHLDEHPGRADARPGPPRLDGVRPPRDGLWVTTWLEPGGNLPEHFHPTLTETWEVLEGSAGVKLAGAWRELTAADGPVLVEPGVRHALRNTSEHTAHLRTWVTPAGRLEEFLRESARAAQDGLYNGANLPTGLRGAAWVERLRPALPRRDRDVLAAAGGAGGRAPPRRAADPPLARALTDSHSSRFSFMRGHLGVT